MKRKLLGRSSLLFCLAFVVGCDSDHDKCETVCHWIDECTTLDHSCSDSDIDECSDDFNDLSDGCEHAFASFIDCLEDYQRACDQTLEHCRGQWDEFTAQCSDEIF
jgi:hypothetical protein